MYSCCRLFYCGISRFWLKYEARIAIFHILAAIDRFSRISWKVESHWGKLESRWRKRKAVEPLKKIKFWARKIWGLVLTPNFLPRARMDLLDWFFSFSTARNFTFTSNKVTSTSAFATYNFSFSSEVTPNNLLRGHPVSSCLTFSQHTHHQGISPPLKNSKKF